MADTMEKATGILTRIDRPDYIAYVCTNEDLNKEQWTQILADAELAEQILHFTKEEQESWDNHMVDLRKKARDLMGDAPAKAWDNLIEGETFELNPERYWKSIIADLEKKRASMEEIDAKLEEDARREAAVTEAMMEMYLENNPPEKPDFEV